MHVCLFVCCILQPPSGDVKSSVSSLGGEWDPSSEVDSVLLSIQSSIEQVEEGGV